MIDLILHGQLKGIGGFQVRRLLPDLRCRSLGPFVFVDEMGPAELAPGQGIDVRPHPHINLATVTFLFDGAISHRDSVGSVQDIEPGDVNWMVAGSGIVHSERTPALLRGPGHRLHGLQTWLALPQANEEVAPLFSHHPVSSLPDVPGEGLQLKLLAGSAFGLRSPVGVYSPTLYMAGRMAAGSTLRLDSEHPERGVYLLSGDLLIDDQPLASSSLAVLKRGAEPLLSARSDCEIAILGGAPLDGTRRLWWNFVSSRPERIEQAKADWRGGRFASVPGETEFIPLPD
jgi:redox-sensitive bicupin YhaK (pirin superfamily)